MKLVVNKPSTFLFSVVPTENVKVFRNGEIYFERRFENRQSNIKVNIPDIGEYTTSFIFTKVQQLPLEIERKITRLPKPQRDNYLTVKPKVFFDSSMNYNGTPAKILPSTGIIHISNKFLSLPIYTRKFIYWHEVGHLRYKSEFFCDLFACKQMIDRGYNESSCIYTLSRVLGRTSQNIERIKFALSQVQNGK